MIKAIYCDRPGCGKLVGAQRIENNKVVEEEYVEGSVNKLYCSQKCCDNAEDFKDPLGDEDE